MTKYLLNQYTDPSLIWERTVYSALSILPAPLPSFGHRHTANPLGSQHAIARQSLITAQQDPPEPPRPRKHRIADLSADPISSEVNVQLETRTQMTFHPRSLSS